MKRKLIEFDLPLAEISDASAREAYQREGHPKTIHVWWARRPLASSRATAFASLVDDPDSEYEREELRRMLKKISPWEAVKDGNSSSVTQAREIVQEQFDGDSPKVLDPYAGGGTIPLEALRLGGEVYSSDYNPVAVLIQKATLTWPHLYGKNLQPGPQEGPPDSLTELGKSPDERNILVSLVEKWGANVVEQVAEEISRFYPEERGEDLQGYRPISHNEGWIPTAYLWTRTLLCQNPNCDTRVPLTNQFWLCNKDNKKIAYRPTGQSGGEVEFELLLGEGLAEARDNGFDPQEGTVSRANVECPICGQVTKKEDVRDLAKRGAMGQQLVAVVARHPDETGKKYRLANEDDHRVYEEASEYLTEKLEDWPGLDSPLPDEPIPLMSGTFNVPIYGLDQWSDLFNARQKLALVTFLETIKASYEKVEKECTERLKDCECDKRQSDGEELARAVLVYLSLALTRLTTRCSNVCVWHRGSENVEKLFALPALPMKWDYPETNVFQRTSVAGFWKNIKSITSVIDHVAEATSDNTEVPKVRMASATELPYPDGHFDAVLTDPPYYNSVPYADLSDFFYVWLKRLIGEYFPDLFSTPMSPKADEAVEMAGWDSERYPHKDRQFFETRLQESFSEIHRVMKDGGVSVIVYAHKTTEGWESMLRALVKAGLVVSASWPIHTEMKSRIRAAQSAALSSSIYMVCRKMDREDKGWWEEVRRDVKKRVEERLEEFWRDDLIQGGDFFISAIGPGMEAFSRYEVVETYSGEVQGVKDLLQEIRSIATDFLVRRLLSDASPGALDPASQFYVTYRWAHKDNRVEFDYARKIASAEGVDLGKLDGGFVKVARKYVYVHGPQDRSDVEVVDNLVDAVHRACQLWDKGKRDKLERFLAKSGYGRDDNFWQFCQAVSECLGNGNKEKQMLQGLHMGKSDYRRASSSGEEQTSLGLDE